MIRHWVWIIWITLSTKLGACASCTGKPNWRLRWPQDLAVEVKEQLGGTSIYLVGMMGSGKSTVGRLLAAALQYCFFDSDVIVRPSLHWLVSS